MPDKTNAALSFALELLKVQQILLYAHNDQILALRRALASTNPSTTYEQALQQETANRSEDWQTNDVALCRLEELIQQLKDSL
jgi:hypothetical protein